MSDTTENTPVRMLVIHNTVRRVHTRALRRQASKRQRFTQKLAGGDLIVRRSRPKAFPEDVIRKNLAELRQAWKEGAIEVRELSGTLIDLDTLQPLAADPALPVTSPNFPEDSAKNDVNPKRPATPSQNVSEPSPHARGEQLPDLLRPTIEDEALEADPETPDTEMGWESPPMEPQATLPAQVSEVPSPEPALPEGFVVGESEVGSIEEVLFGTAHEVPPPPPAEATPVPTAQLESPTAEAVPPPVEATEEKAEEPPSPDSAVESITMGATPKAKEGKREGKKKGRHG